MFYPASVGNLYRNANEIVPECKWNENVKRRSTETRLYQILPDNPGTNVFYNTAARVGGT
eukprot:3938343-Rhodomonas_salina.3